MLHRPFITVYHRDRHTGAVKALLVAAIGAERLPAQPCRGDFNHQSQLKTESADMHAGIPHATVTGLAVNDLLVALRRRCDASRVAERKPQAYLSAVAAWDAATARIRRA